MAFVGLVWPVALVVALVVRLRTHSFRKALKTFGVTTVVGTVGLFLVALTLPGPGWEWHEPDRAGYLAELAEGTGRPVPPEAEANLTDVGFAVCQHTPEIARDQLASQGLSGAQATVVIDAAEHHLCNQ